MVQLRQDLIAKVTPEPEVPESHLGCVWGAVSKVKNSYPS